MGKKGKRKKAHGGRERFAKPQSKPKTPKAQENFDNSNLNEQDKEKLSHGKQE